jgi:hypothetical protein
MTRIPTHSVWDNLVTYYYAVIQNDDNFYSIWKWVEIEYNGYRRMRRSARGGYDYVFEFDSDADALAFKLKFAGCVVA